MCASPGFPQYPHGFPHVYVDAEDGGKVRDAGIQRHRDMGIQGYGDMGVTFIFLINEVSSVVANVH